jgi:hypothetical protein
MGKEVQASLSGQGNFTGIHAKAVRRLFGLGAESPGRQAQNNPGVYVYPFRNLTIGGVTIDNPRIYMFGDEADRTCMAALACAGTGEALLGPEVPFASIFPGRKRLST